MRKAIIVGASSGLGRELARVMAADGWTLGLAGRNVDALQELAAELGDGAHIQALDVCQPGTVPAALDALLARLGGLDCLVISSGVSPYNRKLVWEVEETTLATNVVGFAACANWGAHLFYERKGGHIVGLASVAGLLGSSRVPAYNASKAFESRYMDGLRANLGKVGVAVTDVRPGYIHTPMTAGQQGMFWVVDAPVAARQIYAAIRRRKRVAYVPRRWALVALLLRITPGFLHHRFAN